MGSKTGKRQRARTSKLGTRTDEPRAHKKMVGVKDKLKSDINDGWNFVYVESKPSNDANGSLTIRTRCSPKDFIETVRVLSYEKAEAIAEMGFSAFLSLQSCKFDRALSQMLVDCFDPVSGSLKIHGQSFSLSHVDFEHIMGVNDGGCDIELGGFSDHTERLQLMKHVGGEDEVLRREHLKKFLIKLPFGLSHEL